MLRFVKLLSNSLLKNKNTTSLESYFRLTNCSSNCVNIKNISYSVRKYSSANVNNKCETFNSKNLELIDKDKKLKILQLELDVAKQEGRKVPSVEFLKDEHWEHLLTLNTRSSRTKFYTYLWKLEMKKQNLELKKIRQQEETKKRKEKEKQELEENDHIIYGLMHTNFLLRVYDTTINHWHNNRLIQAMQFGQKLIFDCSYDKHMTKREAINTAKQLMICFAENRVHDEPFDLHFCNVNLNSVVMEYLMRHIPTLLEPSFPLNIHEQCFTEVFPKEKLVYLTPHCRTDLVKYSPDDLYIIGSIVDRVNNEPLSLAKAKKLGLRMARLPLDRYLNWGAGSGKSLTLNQMTNILLDLNKSGDWEYALKHVPKRKLIEQQSVIEKSNFNNKIRRKINKFDFSVKNWAR